MARASSKTFATSSAPPKGFRYAEEFLSPAAERALLLEIVRLPLANARYKEWTANRRVASYGGRYDFSRNELEPAEPIPPSLYDVRAAAAAFAGFGADDLTHALIAEYRAGTQLGWHRDVPAFEHVVGISLLARAAAPAPVSARSAQRRARAQDRAGAALDLLPERRCALGVAARHLADAEPALLDHVSHVAARIGAQLTGCTVRSTLRRVARRTRRSDQEQRGTREGFNGLAARRRRRVVVAGSGATADFPASAAL